MLTSKIRAEARRLSRTSTAGVADTGVNTLINYAQRALATEVKGFPAKEYLAVAAHFDLDTTMAIRLTITGSTNNNIAATDIALASTDSQDNTGTATATALQAVLRAAIGVGADLTVAWTNFYFTLDAIDTAATITIEAPTSDIYFDATEKIFGKTGTGTGTFVGDFPEDCTSYVDLPSDFSTLTFLSWDEYEMQPLPRNMTVLPRSQGAPRFYTIRGKKLFLSPSPTDQKEFYLEYMAIPDDIAAASFDTYISSVIPEVVQPAIYYWVAAELLKGNYEEALAQQRVADYEKCKRRYLVDFHNQTTDIGNRLKSNYPWYRLKV